MCSHFRKQSFSLYNVWQVAHEMYFVSWVLLVLLLFWRSQNCPTGEAVVLGDFNSALLCVYGEFCSPRVVLFIWKAHHFPMFIQLLQSLCGDICVENRFLMMTRQFAVMAVINGSTQAVINIPQRQHMMTWSIILLRIHGFVVLAFTIIWMSHASLIKIYSVFVSMPVCFLNDMIY